MGKVDISGIDKIELLKAMWDKAPVAPYFGNHRPPFSYPQAKIVISGFIDYFCGRAIKMNLSKQQVDPQGYNDEVGSGKFEEIVKELSNKNS